MTVTALIEDITELLAPRAQARKLEIAAYVDERLPTEVIGDAARLRQVLLNFSPATPSSSPRGVALMVERAPNEISFLVRDTASASRPRRNCGCPASSSRPTSALPGAMGRAPGWDLSITGGRITLESKPGNFGSTFEVSGAAGRRGRRWGGATTFAAPDLSGQSIMPVAPQSIEKFRWWPAAAPLGRSALMVSDIGVAQAVERSWHAILLDRALGAVDVELLGEYSTCSRHAADRDVHAGRADELQPSPSSAFTGDPVKPLRAASLAARLTTAPEIVALVLGRSPVEAEPQQGRRPLSRREAS